MNALTRTYLFVFLISLTCGFSLSADAAIKCWTNKEGVKECGDTVPPEYAQQGHQELSKQGTVKEEQKRVKTTEELEAEAKQAAAKTEEELAKK